MTDLLSELKWRHLLHQATEGPELAAHLASGVRRAYVGFDPTADSITIGNLVPLMMLLHWQRAGHQPVVLMGGGTGLIGDPSGKSAERELLSQEKVRANVQSIRVIFDRVLDFAPGPRQAIMADNADWLSKLGYIDLLRGVGKFFSVNQMIARDSVKARLEGREQGISYTEFSYMILQAYDYLHLHRTMGVTVQMGGSDQWGNIVSGCDLIRREAVRDGSAGESDGSAHHAFAITAPLVTKADGGKFGKTESGAIWLSPERTSPYAYYQFWLNAGDGDVGRFLRIFTLLSEAEILDLERQQAADPGARPAQKALARAATELLHGPTEMARAAAAAGALFSGHLSELSLATLNEVLGAAPTTSHDKVLLGGEGLALLELLKQSGVCKSNSEAREALTAGSISVNGRKAAFGEKVTAADLLHGEVIALRRGKKNWHVTRWG